MNNEPVSCLSRHFSFDVISKYRPLLMGLSILSVIFFHFAAACHDAKSIYYQGFLQHHYVYLGSSAVDIFMILSGFGLYISGKQRGGVGDYKHFYIRRFQKILIPYLLVAVPTLIWRDIIIEGRNIRYLFLDLGFYYFFKSGRTLYWYILGVSICYLTFPYFYSIIDSSRDELEAQMRTILLFCLSVLLMHALAENAGKIYDKQNILWLRCFPFVLGIYFGRLSWNRCPVTWGWWCFLLLSIPLVLMRKGASILFVRYAQTFFHFFIYLSLLFILELSPYKSRLIIPALSWLGHYTLEIYLSHMSVREVFRSLGYDTSQISIYLMHLAVVALLSVGLHFLSSFCISWFKKLSLRQAKV